jgi:hypothetical protein
MLTRARGRPGNAGRAALALGLLEMREAKLDIALPLLERAATALPGDGVVQSAYGRALLTRYRGMDDADVAAKATLTRARSVLQKAVTLLPGTADVLAQAARAELLSDDDPATARDLLERAVRLAPSREAYRLMLAQTFIRQDDVARATAVLGPLMARGSRQDVRNMARQLLASAVERARRLDVLSAVVDEPEPPAEPAPAVAAGDSTSGRASERRPDARGGRFTPVLRETQANEERVFGRFVSVECTANGVVLHIQTATRTLRMQAAAFIDIDFISYRSMTPVGIPCGPQTSLPVLATFKRGAGEVPVVVAVELMPDDYVPR